VYERTESDMDEKVLPNSPIFELLESDSNSDAESDLRESHKLNDLLKHKHDKGDKTTLDVPETPLLPETPHSSIGLLANSDPDHAGEGYSLERSGFDAVSENFHSDLTFYIHRKKGCTARLDVEGRARVLVIIEIPYKSLPIEPLTIYKHVVCIVGGAGISTVLPILRTRASANPGRTVLYWACRSPALVCEVGVARLFCADIEVQIRVGERWEVSDLVTRDTRGSHSDVVVIVSGPSSMADDARQAVVQANRARRRNGRTGVIRLIEEYFS
jgi:hypothetical protein